jgi:hypothetical protein
LPLQVSCLLDARAWGSIEDSIQKAIELGRVCDEKLFEVFAHLVFSHPACPAEGATRCLCRCFHAAQPLTSFRIFNLVATNTLDVSIPSIS